MFSFLFAFEVLIATIICSFFIERFLKPVIPKLTTFNIIQQSLLVSLVFLVLTLIVQRPVFSGLAILVFLIIMLAVSNTKFKALKEPMVFSDFAMFAQAFKHPRLYFPFLGLLPVIIAPIVILGLIYAVLTLESAMPFTWQRVLITLVAITVIFSFAKSRALTQNLSKTPEDDNQRYGLQNSLFAYFMQSRTPAHKDQITKALKSSPFMQSQGTPPPVLPLLYQSKPNITVIQSESFFDARRLSASIKKDILSQFDVINAESLQYGKLNVPAWGANTMRSEFAFLTGLKFEDMGFYRYYPYQFLNTFSLSSIASALQTQGYHCVCIHPHPASFFGRDTLFPKLGFDEFIDSNDFTEYEKFGPYISDKTVTEKILETTKEKTDKPLFLFVITMENHGPLHLEKATKEEYKDYYIDNSTARLPTELNDLTVYLRHLKNADTMIKTLTKAYKKADKDQQQATRLCFYGDHIPSIPQIYEETQYDDDSSDYFIWDSTQSLKSNLEKQAKDIEIESLAETLLSDI